MMSTTEESSPSQRWERDTRYRKRDSLRPFFRNSDLSNRISMTALWGYILDDFQVLFKLCFREDLLQCFFSLFVILFPVLCCQFSISMVEIVRIVIGLLKCPVHRLQHLRLRCIELEFTFDTVDQFY